jgi:RNA polymerase sigma-70 factor (ECF subfamily)
MTLSSANRNAITEFQLGSYAAVKELYAAHYNTLVEFATQLILNKPEAHHIVQETFIKLFGMRDRFDKEPDIKAFLFITVRNICFGYIKSQKENEPAGEVAWYEQSLKATDRFEEETERTQALSSMQKGVQELPEPDQLVFRTLFCKRLTIPAAAEQLGLTPVTVTLYRIRAIRLLRDKLVAAGCYSIPLFIYFVAVFCGEQP